MRRASIVVTLAVVCSAGLAAENWPQWRGPGGQGISTEKQLPTEWGPDRNVAWKVELPHGYSSPIVWNDRIFLTSAIAGEVVPGHIPESVRIKQPHPSSVAGDRKHALKVLALDTKTGKTVWEQTAYDGPVFDARHARSTFAGPTAITDGKMVFAYFGPEGLYAYDFTGRLAWKVVEKFHTLGLGTGTSPVLFQNLVIVQRDEDNETSVVVAYDTTTGKEAWKTKRPVQISWSTPALVNTGARTELVTNGNEHVIAYDPGTGKELWRTTGVESNAIHTPLVGKGLVIVTAGYPAKKVIAIRPGDQPREKRVAWTYTKGTGYVLSNILYGDYVYLSTDNGIVTCLDALTGQVKYEGGRPPKPTHFMGSAVGYNGLIAMTSEDGETLMLKAGPTHAIVRTNTIDEPVYSSAALANGRIYIRGTKHLYAIGK
ncbi:MAG: PQQ-binding-like beta-propeller repeat protein [Acidobacteria bacterium]|nr:PQQ-binding-like beta-propeller repeat protein [Acidobacteriota bacterium]